MGKPSGRLFVLVHGAGHGGWCWYKIVTQLQAAGHRVSALDLTAAGINPKQLEDIETIDDYHEPLFSFMEALPEEDRVILVGHSLGGLAISAAMERFPRKIALAVFATAFMPGPDFSFARISKEFNPGLDFYEDSKYITTNRGEAPNIIHFGPRYLAIQLYQLSPPEDKTLATLLVRPNRYYNDEKSAKQVEVSEETYGLVRRAYIISGEDRAITPDVQRWMIQNNPPDEEKEIHDADHMVMISKPQELCSILLELATKYY